MAQQGRRPQPEGPETGRVTGVNRVVRGSRQMTEIRYQEVELMMKEEDTREREVSEEARDVTLPKTAGETKMAAAASNHWSNPAQLRQVLGVDHGCARDGSGTDSRYGNFAEAA